MKTKELQLTRVFTQLLLFLLALSTSVSAQCPIYRYKMGIHVAAEIIEMPETNYNDAVTIANAGCSISKLVWNLTPDGKSMATLTAVFASQDLTVVCPISSYTATSSVSAGPVSRPIFLEIISFWICVGPIQLRTYP